MLEAFHSVGILNAIWKWGKKAQPNINSIQEQQDQQTKKINTSYFIREVTTETLII